MHLFELPKFRVPVEGLRTPLEKWLYFLRHGARLDSENLPPTLEVPENRQALEELIMVTQDERDWARYEDRLKAELDARSFQPVMEGTGRRKEAPGNVGGADSLVPTVIATNANTPEELLKLPEEELRRLRESLEQQLEQRLPPA